MDVVFGLSCPQGGHDEAGAVLRQAVTEVVTEVVRAMGAEVVAAAEVLAEIDTAEKDQGPTRLADGAVAATAAVAAGHCPVNDVGQSLATEVERLSGMLAVDSFGIAHLSMLCPLPNNEPEHTNQSLSTQNFQVIQPSDIVQCMGGRLVYKVLSEISIKRLSNRPFSLCRKRLVILDRFHC